MKGDPTQLSDPNYQLNPRDACLERYVGPIGPLAGNPTFPKEILSAKQGGDRLYRWMLTDNGWAETYFQEPVNVSLSLVRI